MVYYKTREEIELIRQSCLLVCNTLAHVAGLLKPGMTGIQLDAAAEQFIRDHKAQPGFKGYRGFPATLCFSLNEVVVHGIPGDTQIKAGDIVSVDCGVKLNGYYGDAAYTFLVGEVAPETVSLCKTTLASLYKGIEQARVGNRIGDVGYAVQSHAEGGGYGVVRELVGHGLGKNLHEPPDVPNYGRRGKGLMIREGLVIAIEPMITQGGRDIFQAQDGWTIFTKDRLPAAHYEHTIAVWKEGPETLSDHSMIEEAIKKNPELTDLSEKR